MVKKLEAGTTIVLDRYAHSGAAYTAAKNIPGASLVWCQVINPGMIACSHASTPESLGAGFETFQKALD